MAGLNLLTPSGGYVNLSPTNTATNVSLNLPAANGSLISANTGSGAFTTSNFNSASTFGFRNRIINGDMRIDQRNAGASVTPTTDQTYTVDRWKARLSASSKFSVQQSTTAPSGYKNSLLVTSLASTSLGGSDFYCIQHPIEGLNIIDFGFGTSASSAITLSFWVRSSLTGTFSGTVSSNVDNDSYPFTYTISAANTWEQKYITITGPTSGTWLTTNGTGLNLYFSLGIGSGYSGTAGTWSGNAYKLGVSSATSVVGTNGATFYITGVQLEVGSVATPFDFRSYGQELALCQRYYTVLNGGGVTLQGFIPSGLSERQFYVYLKQSMRASPTTTATMSSGAITNTFTGTDQIKFISTSGDFGISSWTASSEL